jgi:hypothetical protein
MIWRCLNRCSFLRRQEFVNSYTFVRLALVGSPPLVSYGPSLPTNLLAVPGEGEGGLMEMFLAAYSW